MAFLIFESDDQTREAIAITHEERGYQVGRHPESDLLIQEDSATSRRHCVIRRPSKNDAYMLDDLGSSNGTYVNGERVWAATVTLHDGDELLIGSAHFIFQVEPHDYEVTSSTTIIVKPEKAPPPSADPQATPKAEPSVMDTVQLDRNRDLPPLPRLTVAPPKEPDPALVLAPGSEINGYEIIRTIGNGPYSTVYLASQTALRRTVAMKVYPVDLTRPALMDDFLAMVQAAGRIQHPNVISYFDTGSAAGFCYLTMTYIADDSIAARLAQRGTFSETEAYEIMVRLAYAVEYVQSKCRLIHYNLKSSNILFNESGDPVIADYGLAEWAATHLQVNRKSFFGNPVYMCAEQVLDRGPDWTCDMYALGVVFYEMLFGKPPFEADTPYRMIEKHLNDKVVIPKNVAISEPAAKALLKMLAKTPEERFSSWQALIRELEVRKITHGKVPSVKASSGLKLDMSKSQVRMQKFAGTATKSIKLPAAGKRPPITLKKIVRKS